MIHSTLIARGTDGLILAEHYEKQDDLLIQAKQKVMVFLK
jgi:hypothetical protein